MIPFVDLKAQYRSMKSEIDQAIADVIGETAFVSGKYAKIFENEFSDFCKSKYTISCANGTDSLEIALRAMGVGPRDEVLVPVLTWISTAESVSAVGAKPVFVDIDEYYGMDVDDLERKVTNKTKAIIPVHLYGHPANMPKIMDVANKYGLLVMEDCAQSHGASIQGKVVSSFGDCASFSFYPGKNLGAYGDAGAIVTSDDNIARVARMIANHGQEGKHNHLIEGRNSRMDGIQAAVLSVKLKYLKVWTSQRRAHASQYGKYLSQLPVDLPQVRENVDPVYHLYVIQCDDRAGLKEHLSADHIAAAIHYPNPLHLMPCYGSLGYKDGDFPKAEHACRRILSLPMFPELTGEQIKKVAHSIERFFC